MQEIKVMIHMNTMTTQTLADTPVVATLPPLPAVSGTATRPIALVRQPRHVLMDREGRYRLSTDSYAEYGRLDFLDLPVASYVSRVHFALKLEDEQLYIRDLGSKNGTKVNGVDIRGKGWVPLKPGDVVEVANVITLILTEIK